MATGAGPTWTTWPAWPTTWPTAESTALSPCSIWVITGSAWRMPVGTQYLQSQSTRYWKLDSNVSSSWSSATRCQDPRAESHL